MNDMKIQKSTLVILLTCFVFFCFHLANAQNERAPKNKKSLLWRISGNGLERPSYLFGTVHILDSAYYFLDDTTIEQLKRSDKVVFENDLDEPDYQQKTLKLAMMENDSLTHYLTDEEFSKLEAFFKNEFNFPLNAVKKMKPFYVASLVGALSFPKNSKSYEADLLKLADKHNKETLGITNPEIENEIISQIPMDTQVAQIWRAIEEYKKGFPQKQKVMEAYQKRDISQIYSIMKEDSNEDDELIYDLMFPERHKVWVPNMIELMQKNSCFFAVGVGHLPGEQGLLEWFKKEGFKVRPVHLDFKFYD
jgi:uncharacterized protein YbaP (TraB family)